MRNFKHLSLRRMALAGALMMSAAGMIAATDAPVKREMRSAWVATVWRLDWPKTEISTPGNVAEIAKQKAELTELLDSMAVNNMNAVNFQIRSRADAMYKSSYEPWSDDLVDVRGMDPGYDPLAFCVEECHRRGMECHAWINPYRYESVKGAWSGLPGDYRAEHPDWIIDVNGASILNPGKPEVTQRICDIIAEVCTNYDIDGVLFDDYFYLSGISDQDAEQYTAYQESGGTMDIKDWRRDNVNRMVDSVYKTIKDIKPWLKFGISPAGIACTNQAVARSYGIEPCPTGSDWQYNDIYSDPIAWLKNQSLDYISPQIYWTIGHTTNYDPAARWWSDVAYKFGRHFYSSHSISSLTRSSKIPGMSDAEAMLSAPIMRATGPNSNSYEEYANEIRLNREYSHDGAPGSIFYSAKYLYSTSPLFAHYLKTTVFNTHALVPSLTWQAAAAPGNVANVHRSGNTLTWDGVEGMRYTVYAVPDDEPIKNFDRDVEYLLGVSYDTTYAIPADKVSGFNFAVCVYDRYGNEYSPIFAGAATGTLDAPELIYPIGGANAEMPFDFEWKNVENADSYIIEIATDAEMKNLLYSYAVNATSCNTGSLGKMPIDGVLYWRVRSCGTNFNDGVSVTETFLPANLEILSPTDGDIDVSLTPVITWNYTRDVEVQIATDAKMENMVYTANATGNSHTVAANVLSGYTTYFVRLAYKYGGKDCLTEVKTFLTVETSCDVPAISNLTDGAKLYADTYISVSPVPGLAKVRLMIAKDTKFTARQSYIEDIHVTGGWASTKRGDQIKISSKALEDGTTYYARVRGSYNTAEGSKDTDFSEPISFVYSSEESGVTDIMADASMSIVVKGGQLELRPIGHAVVTLVDMAGRTVARLFDGVATETVTLPTHSVASGVYVVVLNGRSVAKYVK